MLIFEISSQVTPDLLLSSQVISTGDARILGNLMTGGHFLSTDSSEQKMEEVRDMLIGQRHMAYVGMNTRNFVLLFGTVVSHLRLATERLEPIIEDALDAKHPTVALLDDKDFATVNALRRIIGAMQDMMHAVPPDANGRLYLRPIARESKAKLMEDLGTAAKPSFVPNEKKVKKPAGKKAGTDTLATSLKVIEQMPTASGKFSPNVGAATLMQATRISPALKKGVTGRANYPQGKELFKLATDGFSFPEKCVGYWRDTLMPKKNDTLPFPVISTASGYNRDRFCRALDKIESECAKSKAYKGWSNHRWTQSKNGSAEYSYRGWSWPSGYSVYIADGVLPSRAFYKFIMGKDLDTLPTYGQPL